MKWAALVARLLVGVAFVVFGSNHWLKFIPQPEMILPEPAMNMMMGLNKTPYMDVVKVLEVLGGILLLSGRMVPLGLIILVPVTVNIALWDALMMKYSTPPLGTVFLVIEIFLLWAYRRHFAGILSTNAQVS